MDTSLPSIMAKLDEFDMIHPADSGLPIFYMKNIDSGGFVISVDDIAAIAMCKGLPHCPCYNLSSPAVFSRQIL
jgi:hypothetical protein